MKKLLYIICLLYLVTFGMNELHAQFRSGLTVKALFTDFHTLNEGSTLDFQEWRGGYEIGYVGQVSEMFSFYIPVKVSEVNLPEYNINQRFIGIDGQVQYHFIGRSRKVNPYVSVGAGITFENEKETHTQFPIGLGARIILGPTTDFTAEFAFRPAIEDGRSAFHAGLGVLHLFGPQGDDQMAMDIMPKDRDGDGIPDDIDQCPDIPGLEAFLGCPDSDNDGIQDADDECPTQAGLREHGGCPDTDGDGVPDHKDSCPDVPGSVEHMGCPDSDNDGIPDHLDKCPHESGTLANNGCPEVVKLADRDRDGVPDRDDRCPDEPGSINAYGCPDRDGDGVPDYEDRCIDVPGTAPNRGCPEITESDKETLAFAVQAVEFEFGKATLSTKSFAILDRVADVLKRNPGYALRITGHTDNVGDANRNLQLSERRARSCYEYLSSKGIPVARMSYSGMGEVKPIDSNDTEEGRSRNRRVDFDVYVE